ncbi:MAG: TPM domain-containing protein [Clostridia bacterium]|nr:TPM domain-containing protein [Clostridia bacterium]
MIRSLLIAFAALLLISSFLAPFVSADDHPALVVDESDKLTGEQERVLEAKLKEVSDKYDLDIVVLINDSTGGKLPTEFADDYYDENGYGRNAGYDGILLLVSLENRDITTSTCGKGIEYFNDSELQYIEELLVPYLSGEDYYGAFTAFANECDRHIESYLESQKPKYGLYAVIGIVAGLIFAAVKGSGYKKELVSVYSKGDADDYIAPAGLALSVKDDIFAFSNVAKTIISSSSSSSRGGGSSTHVSSSGRTHGGRSGHF